MYNNSIYNISCLEVQYTTHKIYIINIIKYNNNIYNISRFEVQYTTHKIYIIHIIMYNNSIYNISRFEVQYTAHKGLPVVEVIKLKDHQSQYQTQDRVVWAHTHSAHGDTAIQECDQRIQSWGAWGRGRWNSYYIPGPLILCPPSRSITRTF